MGRPIIDISRKKFSRLTVVVRDGYTEIGEARWVCVCTCGNKILTGGSALRAGKTKSCGCLKAETAGKLNASHMECGKTTEYIIWQGMKRRCLNSKEQNYHNYGGRGVAVCKRWLNSYENFLADMGRRPSGNHSLDRKDNNGNYNKNNCRWATKIMQCNNTRTNRIIQYGYCKRTMAQWARTRKMSYFTLRGRIDKGWSIHDALFKAVKSKP